MNDEKFNDPLADFDPVMESAFSNSEEAPTPIAEDVPVEATETNPVDETTTDHTHEVVQTQPTSEESTFFDDDESFDIDESLFEEPEESQGVAVSKVSFDEPRQSVGESQSYDKNLFKNIKVGVSVELGRTKISLKKLYELKSGSIVEMSRLVGEPLDLVINDQVIARGEVVAVNSNYGIRITHVESLSNIA
ncbi:MAG: flagellar motor switch protein FliN [Candidatus Marinamargulisbacteria bacterium]